ncbi:hypothetical protein [Enterobacter sp. PTB]|uniref:hypothetical protein n=1 Tax=Enterobacter sp. PTB TaxID=3143437 RepID=UPI003DA8D21D
MTQGKDPIAGAIMANNVAWSALLAVLANQGAIDARTVHSELVRMQQRYRDIGNGAIAESLDWYVETAEDIQSEQ